MSSKQLVLFSALMASACGRQVAPGRVVTHSAQPLSVFPPGPVPTYQNVSSGTEVELGVVLWSDDDGIVEGVRFWKASLDTGVHVGHLWRADGTLLATAKFVNESSGGWQEARFVPEVPMHKGERLVASYHTATGFSYNENYYAAQVDAPPLHVPAGGGRYIFGPLIRGDAQFPTLVYNNSNYWVDVDFRRAPTAVHISLYDAASESPQWSGGTYELGVKVGVYRDGAIHGVRFYKSPYDSASAHRVHVWDESGNLLATSVSRDETSSGWQQAPVEVKVLSNHAYVVSYSATSSFAYQQGGFAGAIVKPPLQASAGAGVFASGNGVFPNQTYDNTTYFVDLDYEIDGCAPSCSACGVENGCGHVCCAPALSSIWRPDDGPKTGGYTGNANFELGTLFTVSAPGVARAVRYYKDANAVASTTGHLWDESGNLLATGTFQPPMLNFVSGWQQAPLRPLVELTPGRRYVVSYGASNGFAYTPDYFELEQGAPPLVAPVSGGVYGAPAGRFPNQSNTLSSYWADVVFAPDAPAVTLLAPWIAPAEAQYAISTPFELGLRFQTDVPGWLTKVRFYKGHGNSGPHTAHLWLNGSLLATAPFANETDSGWQDAILPSPVLIQPGPTYVASYTTSTGFAWTVDFFATPYARSPLSAPASAGVWASPQGYPTNVYRNSNYWVDIGFQPQTKCSPKRTCDASDSLTYRLCLDEVARNVSDVIQIHGTIECASNLDCLAPGARYSIDSPGRPITVVGATPGAGFHRTGGYEQVALISARHANGLTISDLVFDEDQSKVCRQVAGANCRSTIEVNDSSAVRVLRVKINWSKGFGVAIDHVNGLFIRDSTLRGAYLGGIWATRPSVTGTSTAVHIENNLFVDCHGGAMDLSARGTVEYAPDVVTRPSTITGNTIQHNGWDGSVVTLPAPPPVGCGGPCGGGQLVLERYTSHLVIANNTISDGADVAPGVRTDGIEITQEKPIEDINIHDNNIFNNRGNGVVGDGTSYGSGEISIHNNRFACNNPSASYTQVSPSLAANAYNNCTESTSSCRPQPSAARCPYAVPTGSLAATPNPCTIGPSGTCATTLSYSTSDATNLNLRVPAGRISIGPYASGTRDLAGVTDIPEEVDLYSDETYLGKADVVGQDPTACAP